MGRVAFTTLAAAGLASSVAGCGGGGSPPGVATLATTTSAGGQPSTARSRASSDAAIARCFDSHGFSASVGSAGSSANADVLDIAGVVIPGANPSSPQFQSAQRACQHLFRGGVPPISFTAAQVRQATRQSLKFVACMRAHGLPNTPDPTTKTSGTVLNFDLRPTGLGPDSPLFKSAMQACQGLLPSEVTISIAGAPHP